MRVGAGVAARDPDREPRQIRLPGHLVSLDEFRVGQVVVAEREPGPVTIRGEHHGDAGASGRHCIVGGRLACLVFRVPGGLFVGETPGEDELVRRINGGERAGGLESVRHADPVAAAGHRVERRIAAHPSHVQGGVGEVAEHLTGLRGYAHRHFHGSGHDFSFPPRCLASQLSKRSSWLSSSAISTVPPWPSSGQLLARLTASARLSARTSE